MARLSGAARRKLQATKREVAGVHVSHFRTGDIQAAVQDELAAQRAIIAAQRERARQRTWAFASGTKRTPVVTGAKSFNEELRDVLFDHVAKVP